MPTVPEFQRKSVVSLFVVLGYVGLTGLGLWLLYALRSLLPPFLVAAIIAMTLAPEVDRIERQGFGRVRVRRGAAIAYIYVLFLAVCGLILRLIPQVSGQMTALIRSHLPDALLHGSASDVQKLALRWMDAGHVPAMMRPGVLHQASHLPELLGRGLQWFSDNLPALAGNLIWVVIVPIIAFFLLLDFNKMLGKTLLLLPKERREPTLTVITDVIAVFGNWVRGVLTVMGLDMLVIGVTLYGVGIAATRWHPLPPGQASLSAYALTLAVTAGILYTIPYFGAIVSTLLIGLVAWVTHGTAVALGVTALMIVIHQIVFDTIIAPRVIGGSVHLHPLLTLLALMAGGTLFGIGGTLLAVPLAAAAQVVIVHLFPQFKTNVIAVGRAARVVQATIASQSEMDKPPDRKEGDAPAFAREEQAARAAASEPSPVAPAPPPSPAPEG